MRRVLAAVVGAVCLVAVQSGMASAADPTDQRWVVVTVPGQPTRVVASGALNAVGTVVDTLTLFPNGTFDNLATQKFPNGNLSYHGAGTFTVHLDPSTCIGMGDVVGPFTITGGTGAYSGATGSGTALIHLTFLFDRTATGCAQGPPSKTYGVARASGNLSIPGSG